MIKHPARRLLFIALISILAILIALPESIPGTNFHKQPIAINIGNIHIYRDLNLKLGLDLVGGSHFVYEAKTDNLGEVEREKAISSLEEVIAQRINLFGVSEANVQRASFEGKDRIIVELPGVEDTASAKEIIGRTAQLVFAEIGTLENQEDMQDAAEMLIPTDLTGADVKEAQVIFNQIDGSPGVGIEFSTEGAVKFERITEKNIGKPLPILLDGQVISAPTVESKITGTSSQITGGFDLDTARDLAIQINAGALPVEIELIDERTIGPTLGEEAVRKSTIAGVIGIILVMVFMTLLYGKLGLVANAGLLLFGVYTLAIYKLIPVVLTLPGIAGFILSIGMAVDANILIFERYREERAKDVSVSFALETAFGRAWDSIRDANIATLFTAFILANPFNWSFLHTSGPVRGFALTLALGILISLFTGVFLSRNLLRLFIKK